MSGFGVRLNAAVLQKQTAALVGIDPRLADGCRSSGHPGCGRGPLLGTRKFAGGYRGGRL